MAGMRDKLIHEYHGVDLETVWQTLQEDVPPLKEKIKEIIDKETQSPSRGYPDVIANLLNAVASRRPRRRGDLYVPGVPWVRMWMMQPPWPMSGADPKRAMQPQVVARAGPDPERACSGRHHKL